MKDSPLEKIEPDKMEDKMLKEIRWKREDISHSITITLPVCVSHKSHCMLLPMPYADVCPQLICSTTFARYHVSVPCISYFPLTIVEAPVLGDGSTTDARTLANNLATQPCMTFFWPPHGFAVVFHSVDARPHIKTCSSCPKCIEL